MRSAVAQDLGLPGRPVADELILDLLIALEQWKFNEARAYADALETMRKYAESICMI